MDTNLLSFIILLLQIVILLIIHFFWPSFLKEKGKNLATKQDISEITDKIENVKSEYSKSLVRFNYFHRKQALVIEKIYQYLVDAVDTMYDLTVPFRWADGRSNQERAEDANKSVFELRSYYKKHRIYLNKDIKEKIDEILKLMYESYSDFDFSQLEGIDRKEKSELVKKSFGAINDKALPIYEELEETFHSILNK